MRFGLLLPHFGSHVEREPLLDGARRAESLGFDSLWVRDHLVFRPHGEFEEPSRAFLDSLTTLAVVGATTARIGLGTAALVPMRHPIQAAVAATSITRLVGDRLVLGIGTGSGQEEFVALGLGDADRSELSVEYLEVLRGLFSGEVVTHDGARYHFREVALEPPPAVPIPLYYCGNTPLSARRAVALCDGWMPGRLNAATLKRRVDTIRELSEAAGRTPPTIAIVPPTVVSARREEALERANVEGLRAWANKARFWVKPPSGRFETLADLAGVLLAGNLDDVAEGCATLEKAGAELVVFDLRLAFDRFLEQVELLAPILSTST